MRFVFIISGKRCDYDGGVTDGGGCAALGPGEKKWLNVVLGKKNRSSEILKLSPLPSRRVLKKLSEKNLIVWHGISVKDPKQYYTINLPGGE